MVGRDDENSVEREGLKRIASYASRFTDYVTHDTRHMTLIFKAS